jgi:rare lipoprotein A
MTHIFFGGNYMRSRLALLVLSTVWFTSLAALNDSASAASTKASVVSSHLAGRKTASGKRYHPGQMTAASKSLPLGSKVLVRNKKTGKSAKVTITDRGPYVKGRGLDLSKGAAKKVGLKGVGSVDVKPLKK